MSELLSSMKRLFIAPFTSPSESSRHQALMRGLPAILIALAGLSAIAWASFGHHEQLEEDYRLRAAESKKEKLQLMKDLRTELRILQASRNRTGANAGPLIDEEDERIIKLRSLQNEERIYLEKLVSLNPEEYDYRYDLAINSFELQDPERGMALMQQAAPEDEPRYAKAHLWLAQRLLRLKSSVAGGDATIPFFGTQAC